MPELTEIHINEDRIVLKDNLVKTAILPKDSKELDRDVIIQGNCILEGAVYARNLGIHQGPTRIKGAVYTQLELHVNTEAKGRVYLEKAVASAQSIVSLAAGCRLHFLSDVSAKKVHLRHAYISACLYADEIILEDCVVIGGVFATKNLELHNCIVGTFNSPTVRASKNVYLLFPSAFSVESISCLPGTVFYNLTLADLGALMKGTEQAPNTGKIHMDVEKDEVRTVLMGDDSQQVLRTYSVVGKVLATDLLDIDKLQNHFLLSCAGLGNQLTRTYDLGVGADGNATQLTPEKLADFFFNLLWGKIPVADMDGRFDLQAIVGRMARENAIEEAGPAGLAEATGLAVEDLDQISGLFEEKAEVDEEGTMDFCIHCGEQISPGSAFCEHCGKPHE